LASLFLVRHAESPWSSDEMRSLSNSGRAASEKLVESLSSLGLAAIYSSPYRRSIETIEPLAKYLGLPIHEVDDLRERSLGSISGTPFEEAVAETFSDFDHSFPGGESSRDAQQRAVRAIDRIREAHPVDRIVIATHGNLISLYLNMLNHDIGFDFWRSLALPDVFQISPSTSGKLVFERIAGMSGRGHS
jgi:2,3-bisphosphoglycerate-dependent phosphoglycerate mutase